MSRSKWHAMPKDGKMEGGSDFNWRKYDWEKEDKDIHGNSITGPAAVTPVTTPGGTVYNYPAAGKGSTSTYVKCIHDGDDLVYRFENGVLLSGAVRYDLHPAGVDLVVDCSGATNELAKTPFLKLPKEFESLRQFGTCPQVISLDWPDRSVPLLVPQFWVALKELFQPNWSVVCCCVGGHGRTGTALAALMVADGWPAQVAMEHVRTWHCAKAIESKSQERYLYSIQDALWGMKEEHCPRFGEVSDLWVLESADTTVDGTVVEGSADKKESE